MLHRLFCRICIESSQLKRFEDLAGQIPGIYRYARGLQVSGQAFRRGLAVVLS